MGEDEADLVAFEVDLNDGRLNQVGDVLQTNGGGLCPFVILFDASALRELAQFAAVDVDGDSQYLLSCHGIRFLEVAVIVFLPRAVEVDKAEPALCNHVAGDAYASGVGCYELVSNGDIVPLDTAG